MAAAQEVRVRLALVGPSGSGKTAALEYLHRTTPADQRGPLVQLVDRSGRTLLYDHVELQYGRVGDLPLYVDVYSLPGSPWAVLARRIVLTGCNGFIYVVDGRDTALAEAHAGFIELCEFLAERGRTPETAALVEALARKDLTRGAPTAVEAALAEHVGDRLLHISTRSGEGVTEAVKKATALALARERDDLEARRQGAPPPRAYVPPALEEEVELAHELYLRGAGKFGAFSPHSDPYLGEILLELGAVTEADLDEALRLRAEAFKLALGVSLEEILTKRGMVDPELIPRARLLRACVEVIHEEITFGKLATEVEAVPFARVKQALGLQAKRQFHNSLDHLLTRAGQLDRQARQRVLCRLLQVHQGELLRDEQPGEAGAIDTPTFDTKSFRALPLFGEVAIGLGLVTQEHLREALEEQRRLKAKGRRRFVGSILQQKGHLTEDDVRRICRALEEKIADDRIQGYEIICPLGRGNMALVFAATQVNLNRVVALKILDPKLLVDQEFVERFLREAQAAARLNHPNIVQVYDYGEAAGRVYLALEFVEGDDAYKALRKGGAMSEAQALRITRDAAVGLGHAHAAGIIHRDVKPANLLLVPRAKPGPDDHWVAKVTDLGLARQQTGAPGDGQTTRAGTILGSPSYMAPEQAEGKPADFRSDIYALGATLYHLVTGRPPFEAESAIQVIVKKQTERLEDPRALAPRLSDAAVRVLDRCMARPPADRYPTYEALIEDLERVLRGDDPLAPLVPEHASSLQLGPLRPTAR
ncbi:MAG: protein kinase, partial [Planctomycetota bacterium]|nr:protein kinase [Planctomycetota bacterium]